MKGKETKKPLQMRKGKHLGVKIWEVLFALGMPLISRDSGGQNTGPHSTDFPQWTTHMDYPDELP